MSKCQGCGKHKYLSRKAAKHAARILMGEGKSDRLSPYQCDLYPFEETVWHLGHLPKEVIAGRWGREGIRHRSDRAPLDK